VPHAGTISIVGEKISSRADGTMIHLDHTNMPPLVVKAVHHVANFVLMVLIADDGRDECILITQAEYATQV
jgi:hypothetical protein